MKLKNYLFLIGLLFCFGKILAQPPGMSPQLCSLSPYDSTGVGLAPSLYAPNANGNFIIRIFVHKMNRSDGTGGQSIANVNSALSNLTTDYASHNICFSLLGIDEINSDYYFYNWDPTVLNASLKYVNNYPNAVNIYIFGDTIAWGPDPGGGISTQIVGSAFAIGGTFLGVPVISTKAISHEMGHCLGLSHTHSDFPEVCDPTCAGNPCVDQLCHCADSVCDTPPDPKLHYNADVNALCVFTNTFPPQPYPFGGVDVRNIMSYTRLSCMSYFTAGQGSRMRTEINRRALLQNFIVPDDLVQNNLNITTGQTKLYDVKNNITETNLGVDAGSNLTLRSGNQIHIKPGTAIKNSSDFHAQMYHLCNDFSQYNSAKPAEENNIKRINSHEIFTEISVIPNPNGGVFRLRTITGLGFPTQIVIRDLLGRTIRTVTNPEQYEFDFDLEKEAPGIYLVNVYHKNKVFSKKIIKN